MKRLLIILSSLILFLLPAAAQLTAEQRNAVNALFGTKPGALEFRDTLAARTDAGKGKPLWHENSTVLGTSPLTADNSDMAYTYGGYINLRYLKNRRALVGENCMVNKLVTVVGVGSWNDDMNNLTNEDLNDCAQFNRVISAGVTVDPVLAIRDLENYYAAGMRAGFCVVASSGSAVLTLDVIKAYSIGFYRDGRLVGTKAVAEGGGVEGVQLSLIQIPGTDEATVVFTAVSDWVFDEIQLDRSGGVQAGIGDLLKVKYAFVGNDRVFPITHYPTYPSVAIDTKPTAGGLYDYTEFTDEADDIRLDQAKAWTPVLGIPAPLTASLMDDMVNIDLTDQLSLPTVLAVGYQGGAKFAVKDANDLTKEVYPAGTEVGFRYTMASALALSAGAWIRMILYDRDGNKVQEETINSSVLGLSLVNGDAGSAALTSSVPFSGAEIRFHTVLSLDVGGVGIYYAYVRMKPDTSHKCDIRPTMNTDLCETQSTFQLRSNPDVSVTWSLVSAPAGSAVSVTPAGYVTNIDKEGEYTFRATAVDGCYEDIIIKSGGFGDGTMVDACSEKLYNNGVDPDKYELSTSIYGSSGALLSASDYTGHENILSPTFDSFAEYGGGLNLASNLRIIGVKRIDGNLIFDGEANEAAGKKGKRMGFVVEATTSGLDVSLLQFLQIRCYHGGTETYRHLITENNAVSAKIVGSSKTTKIRYTIMVPNKDDDDNYIKVDEFMLWKSGVLTLDITDLRIYYAFVEEEDATCSDPLNCSATVISNRSTGARINAEETQYGAVADVVSVTNNLSFLVDDDPESYVTVLKTVSVGGITIAVDMGRTIDYHHQLGLIIDNKTYVANVGIGDWLTVKTYYQGVATGDEFTDWSAIGARVAGYGDKNYLYMQPTAPFDEVRITTANAVGALDATNFYGLFVRSDVDNDGIPDCQDTESCHSTLDDIQINSVCVGDAIVVSALGTISTDYKIKFSDAASSTAIGYNAVDEMVHTTSDASGNIEVRYTTNQAGLFQMVFYDGSGTPLSSAFYSVHPTRTTWKTTATNSDWNKWDNWSDGAPYCCTDVIIPKNAKFYPELNGDVTIGDEFCCQNIHFEPGGAVGAIVNLDYAQAWVETDMKPNRYVLFSSPLKYTYTGDMFVPASMMGVHQNVSDYFEELNGTTSPQNRFNPTIYQRKWYSTSTGRKWETDDKDALVKYETLAGYKELTNLSLTKWSRHFNLLNHPYALGQGMSIWVDNGDLPEETLFRFRFPKWQASYDYYSDFDQNLITNVSETIARRDRSGGQPNRYKNLKGERFIYETDFVPENKNKTFTFDTENLEYKKFEDRVVYNSNESFPSTVTLTAEASTDHFVFGNPFMSRIDVEKFLIANEANLKAVKFYDGNTLKSVTISGGLVVGTTEVSYIAPMQAVLVEAQTSATSTTVSLSKDMLKGQHGESDPIGWPAYAPQLNISVSSGPWTATMAVTEEGSAETEMLFDNEVVPQVAVFGVKTDGSAYDIIHAADEIPLGFYLAHPDTVTISFRSMRQFPRQEYVLTDQQTNMDFNLDDDIRLLLDASSYGRFVLRKKLSGKEYNGLNGTEFVIRGREALVRNADGIRQLLQYDMQGRLITRQSYAETTQTCVTLRPGVNILRIQLPDGHWQSFKAFGK